MKKLLAILGSTSLIATAGMTVIACSNDAIVDPPIDPGTGKEEINNLIKKLEAEVVTKWASQVTSPIADSATLLDVEASQNNLAFLAQTNLQQVYARAKSKEQTKEQLPVKFYDVLANDEKNTLKNNVEALLSPAAKINDLRKSISVSAYQTIIGTLGTNWLEDIKFDFANAVLNYTESENSFLANIEMGYSMQYSYIDAEDAKQSKTQKANVSITVSDDGVIIETIKKVQEQFAGDLLKSADSLVWIDQNALKIEATEIVGGKTERYDVALEEYYKTLANGMTNKIRTDYFEKSESQSPILQAVKVVLNDSEDVIRNRSKVTDIGALQLERAKITTIFSNNKDEEGIIFPDDIKRQKIYLGNLVNDSSFQLGDGSKATNAVLYNDLQDPFKASKAEYDATFKLKYDEITKESGEIEEAPNIEHLMSTSVANEQVTIKGIGFELNNGYKQNLNDITIDLSVAVDSSSTSEETINGKIFAGYYNASAIALNQFHNFYGISPTDTDELPATATNAQKALIFYMSGLSDAKKSDGSDFNIWEYWQNIESPTSPFGAGRRPRANELNDALNLVSGDNPEAIKIKNEYFISKLQGTDNFSISYEQWDPNLHKNLRSFTFADKTDPSLTGLSKGMRAQGKKQYGATLEISLSNDLFKITFGQGKGQDYFDGDGTEFTMIGRK